MPERLTQATSRPIRLRVDSGVTRSSRSSARVTWRYSGRVVRYRRDATGDTSAGPVCWQPQRSRCGVSSLQPLRPLRPDRVSPVTEPNVGAPKRPSRRVNPTASTATAAARPPANPVTSTAGDPGRLRACASRRSWAAAGTAVPAVAAPGTTEQATEDDRGVGQRQPELHHRPAALGAPAQLAVLVAPRVGPL